MALCAYPELLDREDTKAAFPPDACARCIFVHSVCVLMILEAHLSTMLGVWVSAQAYVKANRSLGAYSGSQGLDIVREEAARFIFKRCAPCVPYHKIPWRDLTRSSFCCSDGHPADPKDIFLTAGASEGVKMVLQCAINSDHVG